MKKRTTNLLSRIPYLVVCALLLAACNHKELCFDHDPHTTTHRATVLITYEHEWQYTYDGPDWENDWPEQFHMDYDSLRPLDPAGLRIVDYTPGGTTNILNLPPSGGAFDLAPGEHSLLFYNNDTENIIFNSLSSYYEASATTRPVFRTTYSRAEGEETYNAPDMLYGHSIDSYNPDYAAESEQLAVRLIPLVFTYEIRCPILEGKERVKLARGALSGMARSTNLRTGRTNHEQATVLFDLNLHDQYGVHAEVRSFGIPDFSDAHYTRTKTQTFGLQIEVLLADGKLLSYDFDVTELVALQPNGGVLWVDGIIIPDDVGDTSGSGMDVDVDGWGEYQDIDLPINK